MNGWFNRRRNTRPPPLEEPFVSSGSSAPTRALVSLYSSVQPYHYRMHFPNWQVQADMHLPNFQVQYDINLPNWQVQAPPKCLASLFHILVALFPQSPSILPKLVVIRSPKNALRFVHRLVICWATRFHNGFHLSTTFEQCPINFSTC